MLLPLFIVGAHGCGHVSYALYFLNAILLTRFITKSHLP